MISLLCYWWILLWDVNVNKEAFAVMSTLELAIELVVLVPFCIGGIYFYISERKRKNAIECTGMDMP